MLYISDFMRDFHKNVYEVMPEEFKRYLVKEERGVRHALYMVVGQYETFRHQNARFFQEGFHVRIDQMAADYRTWKRAGCKPYARPKQYVSGRVAGASKKAFDMTLSRYILLDREREHVRVNESKQTRVLLLEENEEIQAG